MAYNPTITVKDQGLGRLLLRLAWGPRRVTRKTRYGKVQSAYPAEITAALSLWLTWLRIGAKQWALWRWQVVIPTQKAKTKSRTKAALVAATVTATTAEDSALDIEAMQAKRAELRARGMYAEADKIRDELAAVGVTVRDGIAKHSAKAGEPAGE